MGTPNPREVGGRVVKINWRWEPWYRLRTTIANFVRRLLMNP